MEEIIGNVPNSSMVNGMGQNAPVQSFVAESPQIRKKRKILDVGINKPFKDRMRAYYDDYMLKSYPEPGKITRQLMGTWVADAWESLPVTAIINTAKKIGFIN